MRTSGDVIKPDSAQLLYKQNKTQAPKAAEPLTAPRGSGRPLSTGTGPGARREGSAARHWLGEEPPRHVTAPRAPYSRARERGWVCGRAPRGT